MLALAASIVLVLVWKGFGCFTFSVLLDTLQSDHLVLTISSVLFLSASASFFRVLAAQQGSLLFCLVIYLRQVLSTLKGQVTSQAMTYASSKEMHAGCSFCVGDIVGSRCMSQSHIIHTTFLHEGSAFYNV